MTKKNTKASEQEDKTNNIEKIFDSSFWILVIIFIFIIGIICFLPYWFTKPALTENLNFSSTGQIGDTIGGTMTPFIAIAAALLTFIAFWVQYKANIQQAQQFKNQANDVTIERFENKFYELLRIQRENTTEINISDVLKGRKAFISMFYEFRFCYAQTKKFIKNYNKKELGFSENDEEKIIDIAYHIFFMGIGDNSNKLVKASLTNKCDENFIEELLINLEENIKEVWRNNKKIKFKVKYDKNKDPIIYSSKYLPLGGHISRLGHYFRHLYQSVNFIAEQDQNLFKEEVKCEYAKTLRAQLSDYEQLLLFYNVCSTLGKSWTNENQNFIKRFRMIKNMPLPLSDFGIIPEEKFEIEIKYWKDQKKAFFEWEERKK